jgi:hypothetical protein
MHVLVIMQLLSIREFRRPLGLPEFLDRRGGGRLAP